MFKLEHWYVHDTALIFIKKRKQGTNLHYDYEVDVWGENFSPNSTAFVADEKCHLFSEVPKEVADIIRGGYDT